MATQTFTPHPQHRLKMRLVMTIIACLIMLGMGLIAIPISFEHDGLRTAAILLAVTFGLNVLWWVPAIILVEPYYRSLSYEIQDDQVVMRVGLATKSVKHVPYRTVTNITVKQDLIDRMLGLGTLEIQTAGMSGTNTAEQSLAGLEDAQQVYEIVAARLRQFRGAMSPTAAEEIDSPAGSDAILGEILSELRAIRQKMEK